jgi:hypothetical protein
MSIRGVLMSKGYFSRAASVVFAVGAAAGWCSVFEANADTGSGADFLDGSTHAIVMGPTFIPDPTTFPGYIPGAVTEYLQPLGFSDAGTITPLITEESPNFGPSIASGVDTLVHAIEADYDAGDFSAVDPLTVFATANRLSSPRWQNRNLRARSRSRTYGSS